MADLDWKSIWKSAIDNKSLFPNKLNNNTLSIACPTRFSTTGKFSIEVSPQFNDDKITLKLLYFNDNVDLTDLPTTNLKLDNYNSLAKALSLWEESNRLSDRFEIESAGFTDSNEAEQTLIDYLNNKATESGRMFDDKLDELNNNAVESSESYIRTLNSFKENRKLILSKIACILNNNYNWRSHKNEDFSDSVASFYDKNGNLAAVVTLVDQDLIIDLSKNITSKINVMQSDSDIENEITTDIDSANKVLAAQELKQLEDTLAANERLESLTRRLVKLENYYLYKFTH